jgi:cation diffusion facilitator family transporter
VSQPQAFDRAEADRHKRLVALSSVVAALCLTGLKIAAGVLTGSLGVLSEAAHSSLDLVAAAVTYFAVRGAGRPADHDHTYGHGKFENLSALAEVALLLITCVWIAVEAVRRLFFVEVPVDASGWAFLVLGVSIVVDLSRSRALGRAAKRYSSQALEADALHFSTDVWSSATVIAGLLLVWLAPALGAPWLVKADAVAALGVAGISVWVGVQLARRAVGELTDRVSPEMLERVTCALRVDGVVEVVRLRLRRSGPETFADATLTVADGTPIERAHAIADSAEAAVAAIIPGADVVIHVEPGGNAPLHVSPSN